MSSDAVSLSLWEKCTLTVAVLVTYCKFIIGVLTFPFQKRGNGTTLKTYRNRLMFRTLFGLTTLRQQQSMIPLDTAFSSYETIANRKGFKPITVDLLDGAKGLWIGDPALQDVILYFVGEALCILETRRRKINIWDTQGGGYVLPFTMGHLEYCCHMKESLSRKGHEVAILVIQYTLSPQTVYPKQLIQCVGAVRYAISDLGKQPSKLILAGDSAGASLALSVVAHVLHPHPDIDSLRIGESFRGLLLISPWARFGTDDTSWKENYDADIIAPGAFESWAEAYCGDNTPDNYNEPCRAKPDWWKELKVCKVMITSGREECLLDSIKALATNIKVRLHAEASSS